MTIKYGFKTPEELIDLALNSNDKIVSTDCGCCGKVFYILESDLYKENDFRNGENDYNLGSFYKIDYPKCPHCGFAGELKIKEGIKSNAKY